MIGRRSVFAAVVAVATLSLAGCELLRPASTIRFKMSVEVETPAGLRRGESVIETSRALRGGMGDASGIMNKDSGEAVAVDLPEGTLFALLQGGRRGSDYISGLPHNALEHGRASPAMPRRFEAHEWREEREVARRIKPTIELDPADYPTLVRFRDIRDPKSVELVDPAHLAASFGPGVKLRRITIQITDDPVTTGIEKRFPWWSRYRDHHFDNSSTISEDMTSHYLSAHMSSGSFSTEFNK